MLLHDSPRYPYYQSFYHVVYTINFNVYRKLPLNSKELNPGYTITEFTKLMIL